MNELTEQWNNGTLPVGWYFIKINDRYLCDYYCGYFILTGDKSGLEVLNKIPDVVGGKFEEKILENLWSK